MTTRKDEIQGQKRMGMTMQALAWIVLLGLGVFFFGDVLEKQYNPNQAPQVRLNEGGVREVVLKRNRFGHYVTTGLINGHAVTFMLDTGATGVAIPSHIAQALGLRRGQKFTVQTANGLAASYATEINRISVGGIEMQDVSAAIAPGLQGDEILLGMSFLKHIEFTQRGDVLILREYL